MSAHVELQLLVKIVETGNLRAVLDEGITSDHFGVVENRTVYSYLLDYFHSPSTRSLVPERELLEEKFMTMDFPEDSDRSTIKSLCHEIKMDWLRLEMENMMHSALENYEDDPSGALIRLTQETKSLQSTAGESRDVILSHSAETMKQEYKMLSESQGLLGIPWPTGWGYHTENGKPKILKKTGRQHHPLNEQSGGMRAGEFILFYGRPKSMKTWILVDLITECYMNLNQRVLVYSKEMTPEQLRWRIVARMLGVDYIQLKSGQLPEEQREEFFDLLDTLKVEEDRLMLKGQNRSMMITTGWQSGGARTGMQSLQAKIEEFEPDIVMADSVYLMKTGGKNKDGAMWQDMVEIAYGLHDLAGEYKIPIVATSQANRKGEEMKGSSMAEIAYGDAFAQACDLAIRVIKTLDDSNNVFLSLVFSGARELKMPGIRLEVEIAQKFQLDQVFESQRQIMAQFKAEEEAIAQEEERMAKKRNKDRSRKIGNFRNQPEGGDAPG